jgi:hypothetical protein
MFTPTCFKPRVRIPLVAVLLLLSLIPQPSKAIQVRWSNGTTDLNVTENTRAVLLVQADSAEVTLPPQWRLLWTADSSGVQFAALDSAMACLTDTARVFEVDPPSTPADSAANEITMRLCSAGSAMASTAYFLVDIIGGSQGKLKVIALDQADSSHVIESNEATFNGGVDGSFQPAVLSVTQTRTSTTVSVTAIGSDLSTVLESRIVAPDSSWVVPLTPVQRTSTSLTANADVPASLPPAILEVSGGPGRVASAPLSGDQIEAPAGDYSYGYFRDSSGVSRPRISRSSTTISDAFICSTSCRTSPRRTPTRTSADSGMSGARVCGMTGRTPTLPPLQHETRVGTVDTFGPPV